MKAMHISKIVVCAFVCAAMHGAARAGRAGYSYDAAGGTANINSDFSYVGDNRIIIYQGTVNLNEGAYLNVGGDSSGDCNFIGVDKDSPAALNVNGGTLWCSTDNGGAGVLGVGNNNNGVTSIITLNSGLLRVDTQLRSSTLWSGMDGGKSSGTININGGEAIVGQYCIGADTDSTGTSTLNLNGGTLTVNELSFRGCNGQVFNWGNGTLVAAKDNIFSVATYSGSQSRTMAINGGPASFDTAGYVQTIPAFTGTGSLRLTGDGAVAFQESVLSYGLILDGVTLELGTLNSDAARLTTTTLKMLGSATLKVTLPSSVTGRYPLIACTSSFSGSLGNFTVDGGDNGRLVREGNTLYLSFEETDDRLVLSDPAGGEVVPTSANYSRLVFADGAGAFTVGGEGITLSQDIADSSAANQIVSAPVTLSTENSSIYVGEDSRLVLNGALTATHPYKEGNGTLVFRSQPTFSNMTVREGTVDFGGLTYEGIITQGGMRFYGQDVVLTNGTWYPNQNHQYNFFNLCGQTVTIADGFTANFTRNGSISRIAMGFQGVDGDESAFANLVIDGGTFMAHGDQGGNSNFIGVDCWGTHTLEVKRGKFWVTGGASGGGTLRVAANNRPYLTGIVRVSGGLFKIERDLTFATLYYGTEGGQGKGIYEQTGGKAEVQNFYIGATTSTGGRNIVKLTGGELNVRMLKCLACNKQSLLADGATIKAMEADTDEIKFMTADASTDSYEKKYEIGSNGLTIDTAGYTVSCDIPWTGSGDLTVSGAGGILYMANALGITGNVVISENTTFAIKNSQTWAGTFTLREGAKIRLDTSAISGEEVITLTTAGFVLPDGETDVCDFVEVTGSDTYRAIASTDGKSITLAFADAVPAYAYWTGAGSDPTNFSDPANWACTNSAGSVVEGGVPITATVVVLNNGTTTFSLPQGFSPSWGGVQFGTGNGTVVLGGDCDVYAAGRATLAPGAKIDLNGYDLKVKSLSVESDGEMAVVTNSVADVKPLLYTDNARGEAAFIDLEDITVCTNALAVKIYGNDMSTTEIDVGTNFDVDYIQTNGIVTASTGFKLGVGAGTGRCAVSGGTLTATAANDGWAFIGSDTGTGILELSGDACVTLPSVIMGHSAASCARMTIADSAMLRLVHYNNDPAYINIGHATGSDCKVVQTGGTVSVGGDLNVGVYGATASYEMQGGTLTVGRSFVPGREQGGTGTFAQSGGTVNANSYLSIGYLTGHGTYVMTGGELNATAADKSVQVGEKEGSSGELDIAGGIARIQKINVGVDGATGTLRVRNGGRLVLVGDGIVTGNGSTAVEFAGGIIETTKDNAALMSGLTNIVVGAGGLTLANDYAVGFANCTFKVTPEIADVPAIVMTGTGSLDLSNCTITLAETPIRPFVLAAADEGTITFSGTSTVVINDVITKTWKMSVSSDGKRCIVSSVGFSVILR